MTNETETTTRSLDPAELDTVVGGNTPTLIRFNTSNPGESYARLLAFDTTTPALPEIAISGYIRVKKLNS